MPRILIIDTYYPEFLTDLYRKEPDLSTLAYDQQINRIFAKCFGVSDAYSTGLRAAGAEAQEVICNADVLQSQWAQEHDVEPFANIHDRRRQIVAAQINHYRPDILLVFELCPLGDSFLADMKKTVRFLVGQIASPLPPKRTFAAYDGMISFWPPLLYYFRRRGIKTERMNLAFDSRILSRLPFAQPKYDVSFVGGFASNHTERISWLEDLLAEVPIHIFGYGLEQTVADSPIRRQHHGEAEH